jgi:CheY-like chemotaxis protein
MKSLILVAEDEREIRELFVMFLEMDNFSVIVARNGEEAIAQAKVHRPDLILMDVRMPKLTGYQACEMLKAAPETKDIPVVFLSAYANANEVKHGLELGAEKYLAKPIAPDALNRHVTEVLEWVRAKKRAVTLFQ